MNHSDIDHENMTSAYLKVIRGEKQETLNEARLVTRDGKFIVMTDNDTEAATFEDRESALEYIKNNKEKLMVRDDKAKPATTDKIEAKEGKETFVVPEEIVDTKERNAFMGAAAAAHKAGKTHFNFGGKKHKVTMGGDTAKAINSSVKEDARDHCHSKDHDCATIVHHPKWGIGKPIYESHAVPTDDGYVAWYDVEFDHGIEREVPTEDMTVYTTEKHKMNAAKKVKEEMKCGPGQYYCKSSGTCKPIPDGMKVDDNGDLVKEAVKYPHAMYDPKTGKAYKAKKVESIDLMVRLRRIVCDWNGNNGEEPNNLYELKKKDRKDHLHKFQWKTRLAMPSSTQIIVFRHILGKLFHYFSISIPSIITSILIIISILLISKHSLDVQFLFFYKKRLVYN